MKCSKCNNEVKEGKYCKYCGNRLDKSKDDTYFIIGILLIIFFPIVGIIFCAVMMDKDRRLGKIIKYYLLFWVCIIILVVVSILLLFKNSNSNVNVDNDNEKVYTINETKCYSYCGSESFTVELGICTCEDGRQKDVEGFSKKEDNDDDKTEVVTTFNKEEWKNDVKSDNYVINVVAGSTCPHCHNFRPIIEEVSKVRNIKLYFVEIDKINSEDYNTFLNTIKNDFSGSVPYTFITKNGKVLDDYKGEMDKESTIEFLNNALNQ